MKKRHLSLVRPCAGPGPEHFTTETWDFDGRALCGDCWRSAFNIWTATETSTEAALVSLRAIGEAIDRKTGKVR